jgi:hypothetical protein
MRRVLVVAMLLTACGGEDESSGSDAVAACQTHDACVSETATQALCWRINQHPSLDACGTPTACGTMPHPTCAGVTVQFCRYTCR